jgi:pimeloyl-ACP methyl ester carboxylesterase
MNAFLHTMRRAAGVLLAAAALQPVAHAANAPRAPQAAAAASAIQSRTIDANGVGIHYLQAGYGDATPVVLLHGYTETSRMWQPLVTRLAGERVVIAPDLPGAGGSAMPASGYDKKTLAQDIHAMVQALGFRKVKLVGHDIVLMDAFLPGVGDWQKVWLLRDKWHFNFYGDTPEKLVRGRERIFFEHFWNDFAADPARSVSEADRRYYSAQYARNGRMRAGFEYFHAFPQDANDFAAFARTPLQMPMLVLTGERASGTFLIDQAKLVATNVQGVVVPGAGHWLMEEAPDATIAQLVRFIDAPSSN